MLRRLSRTPATWTWSPGANGGSAATLPVGSGASRTRTAAFAFWRNKSSGEANDTTPSVRMRRAERGCVE
jgi:hypothetical protein